MNMVRASAITTVLLLALAVTTAAQLPAKEPAFAYQTQFAGMYLVFSRAKPNQPLQIVDFLNDD